MAFQTFKNYRIKRLLGKGGMAEVFLARDQEKQCDVALKLMLMDKAGDESFKKRFLHEIEAHSNLNHPNIVTLHEGGQHDGRLYMAMEFIDGWTLQKFTKDYGKVPTPVAIYIVSELLKGLQYTHDKGVVHRDVKPANLMISRSTGEVKIADFGIVKGTEFTMLTQTGQIIGTPAYMSPEQATGKSVDGRTDVYSAGVVLYEILTGSNPFMDENIQNVIMKIIQNNYPPIEEVDPTVPNELIEVIGKVLAKEADERYKSAKDVVDDLAKIGQMFGTLATQEYFRIYSTNPSEFSKRVREFMGHKYYEYADQIYRKNKAYSGYALVELKKAVTLAPEDENAHALIKRICSKRKFHFESKSNSQIRELEKKLEKDRDNYTLIMQMAKTHQSQGNFFEALRYYKRLKKMKPNDQYVDIQIEVLMGTSGESGRRKAPRLKMSMSMLEPPTKAPSYPQKPNINTESEKSRSKHVYSSSKDQSGIETTLRPHVVSESRTPTPGSVPVSELPEREMPGEEKTIPHLTPIKEIPKRKRRGLSKAFVALLVLAMIVSGAIWKKDILLSKAQFIYKGKGKQQLETAFPSFTDFQNAERAYEKWQYDDALEKYQSFLQNIHLNPAILQARYRMAEIYFQKDQLDKALETLDQLPADSLAPDIEMKAGILKARIHSRQGDRVKARNAYKDAFKLLPKVEDFDLSKELTLLYGSMVEEENPLVALEIYNGFIQQHAKTGKMPEIHLHQGICYTAIGNKKDAEEALLKVMDECAPNSDLYKQAQDEFNKATKQ